MATLIWPDGLTEVEELGSKLESVDGNPVQNRDGIIESAGDEVRHIQYPKVIILLLSQINLLL